MSFTLSHDRRNISDGDLLADMRNVARNTGMSMLKQSTYRENGKYGVTTVIRRFGGWNEAVKAANLLVTVERNIPDEKLFDALFGLWVGLGRQPAYAEVQAPLCLYSVTTFERRFGSWRQALEAFVAYTAKADLSAPDSASTKPSRKRTQRIADLRLRFRVMARDRFRCVACGASPAITPGVQLNVDHITPWSLGGETVEENLQTLCVPCNQGKSNVAVGR